MAIVVKVSVDRLEAVAEVEREVDEQLELDALKRALATAAVTYGIDEQACHGLIATANQDAAGAKHRAIVASATPPVHGSDGSIEMTVGYVRNTVGTLTDHDAIDFHNRGSYTPIKQGQVLARIALPTPGVPGTNVLGHPIKANPGIRAKFTAGKGTKVEADGTELQATREGDLRVADGLIEVMDSITVAGNLDYKVGNIDCEGKVRVEGDVLPGFHIHATGDVWIGGIVDNAEVTTLGIATIVTGVLGGSRICARHEIKVGYVRAAYLESDGNIVIGRESLNSTVVSGDTISTAEGGRVVGGRLFAQNGIETGVAGHEKGTPTTLATGINPLKELRAAKLQADLASARGALIRIGKMKEIAKPGPQEILDHLLAAAAKKHEVSTEELAKLEEEKAQIAACRITVRKQIHPGVRIRIGTGDLRIEDESMGGTFQYDIESGQIVKAKSGR